MKQLFSDIGQQAAEGHDPWENRNKLSKPYSNPCCVCGSTFHSAAQGEDKAHRVLQYCRTGKRDIGDQGKWGSFNLWSIAPQKSNLHRKIILENYKRVYLRQCWVRNLHIQRWDSIRMGKWLTEKNKLNSYKLHRAETFVLWLNWRNLTKPLKAVVLDLTPLGSNDLFTGVI